MDLKQIEELLKNHEERIKKIEMGLATQNQMDFQKDRKKISIKEFILEKNPKGTYYIGLAIAYYLEKFQGMSSFCIEELEQGFRDAKEPLPKNMSDLTYKNTKNGLMMEAKEQKNNKNAWTLTNTGEKLVENNFQKAKKM